MTDAEKITVIQQTLFGKASSECDQAKGMKDRIAELEREVQDYKEENVRLTQQCLDLFRAVKKANCHLDAIEETCDNDVWFQQLRKRTY